mgnify:CR=1 FL=1
MRRSYNSLMVGKKGAGTGMSYRNDFAELNSVVFDNLRGIDEILQYGYGKEVMTE